MAEIHYDVLVVGASLGGVAAALRAGAMGASTCLIDESAWVGGQFTSQGVCKPDETKYVETVGSNALYRDFRHLCRAHYRNNYRLSAKGALLNPFDAGSAFDTPPPRFAAEPKVADAILKQMLSQAANVHYRPNTTVTSAELAGDAIAAIDANGPDGSAIRYTASVYLDATDLGELLPRVLRADEWVVGAEAAQPGEFEIPHYVPGAPATARPEWIQPITFCIALERMPSGDYTIQKPENYDALKALQGYDRSDGLATMFYESDPQYTMTKWNYRRYLCADNFADPSFPNDLSMINTAGNDYQGACIPGASAAADLAVIAAAKEAALGYLYWLQTECPRDGEPGSFGYPELRPNPDAWGTADGIAPTPYIRESRRILALKTIVRDEIRAPYSSGGVTEQDPPNSGPRAALFEDTCGIGAYSYMDCHALSGNGAPGFWIDSLPAQIALGALVPRRVTNFVAACKNVGTTHFTNGLYRLHPIEWAVGEAAGALAAFSVRNGVLARDVRGTTHLLRAYQRRLLEAGVPLYWWTDVQPGDALWPAVQMAGATKVMTGADAADLNFNASEMVSDEARSAIEASVGAALPGGALTRGQAAQYLFDMGLT